MMKRFLVLVYFIGAHFVTAAEVGGPIETIRAVGNEGEGNAEAAAAWQSLIEADGSAIPEILAAMNGANSLAANWLRSAAETIADREMEAGAALPIEEMRIFLGDTSHDEEGRVLAFELIERVDAIAATKLVPGMVNDPSVILRRGAVKLLLDEARAYEKGKWEKEAVGKYREALDAGRDLDQIEEAVKGLRSFGEKVDLPKHFGFLMHWQVVAPFDNTGRAGFDVVYPPEEGVDIDAKYEGKDGEVGWEELVTADEYGMVNFNKPFGMLKEVVGYAYTEFESEEEREVELRLGCKNGWKVWVNGELLFGRDEYHRGIRIDQYRMPVTLKKGRNEILVKACQDHQTQEWTVEWQFQLRVCDATGSAVLAANRKPTPTPQEQTDKRRG